MRRQGMAILFGVAAALLLRPGAAWASGLPKLFENGPKIFRAGPLPEPFDKEEELQGYESGYACDVRGLLGSYYAVANCRPVAFQGDSYIDEPQLVSAIQARYPESAMRRGFWGRFGWLVLLATAAGAVAFGLRHLRSGRRSGERGAR